MSIPSHPALPSVDLDHTHLREQIDRSLHQATLQKHHLQKIDRQYSVLNIVLGAIAAFIAGQSAIADKPAIGNWRNVAMVASGLTLTATIASGVQKQIAPTDLVAEVSQCVAQLKALKIETLSTHYELEAVSDAYQKILTEFSRVDL